MDKITVKEFKKRLIALCSSGRDEGIPRKRRDQLILLVSIALAFTPDRRYSEFQINELIKKWTDGIGQVIGIDHVTLRRMMVDEGLLVRDDEGSAYRVDARRITGLAEAGVGDVDPDTLIEDARQEREERRQRFMNQQ